MYCVSSVSTWDIRSRAMWTSKNLHKHFIYNLMFLFSDSDSISHYTIAHLSSIVISTFTNYYPVLVVAGNATVFFQSYFTCVLFKRGYNSGASWVLFELLAPHPPTIHYTLPRFILSDPGLQLLGSPQKQGVVRDNDKSKDQLRAHERRMTPPQDLSFRFPWDSVSRSHKTSKLCMLHTRPCGTSCTHNAPTI